MRWLNRICAAAAILIALIGLVRPTGYLGAAPLPRSVLVITQSSPSSGGAIAVAAAFGSDPNVNSTSRIAVYAEHLDLNRFPSPQYRQLTRSYFRDKYRETPIGVVVVFPSRVTVMVPVPPTTAYTSFAV